jgi:hypothetical protein
MSTEKTKKTKSAPTPTPTIVESYVSVSSPSHGTYSVMFPPGPMGLHLAAVTDGDRAMGAQVRGYHFPESYKGISCAVIKDTVKEGDIISLIDDVDVAEMSFKAVFNILLAKTTSNKLVTFQKNSTSNTTAKESGSVSMERSASGAANSEQDPPPALDITPLKSLFPVRYEELSHVLLSVGTHIASLGGNFEKGLISVGASIEDKTVQVLGKTAKHVPRYSQQDMDFVESKMCAILQELSQTCILLGKSEAQVQSVQQQMRAASKQSSSDRSAFATLRDTNAVLAGRIEKILHELASEQANRDAWMARAKAAEEESQSAWEKVHRQTDRQTDRQTQTPRSAQLVNHPVTLNGLGCLCY